MTRIPTPGGHRHLRLRLLEVIVSADVPFALVEQWLPQPHVRSGDKPIAFAHVERCARPDTPRGSPIFMVGDISVWSSHDGTHAILLGVTGHGEVDLDIKRAIIDPGSSAEEASTLLTLASTLLLARTGNVLLNASAVLDDTSGGWLVLGPRVERTALLCEFVAHGGKFVSDGSVLVRRAEHQDSIVVVESWHRSLPLPPDIAAQPNHPAGLLTLDNRRSVAQVRGVLLARSQGPGRDLSWVPARRDEVLEHLARAVPFREADPQSNEFVNALLASCASKVALQAPFDGSGEGSGGALHHKLSNAVEVMLR